ncbi:Carbonyl reductase family member 4 [Elsinoe australis]|uniref:Carbonyl reductase family member 4 n=1 Tax=Elsinoe australis TaxID=40998 RepID=A0A2P7YKS2_9PEZI|nr:Carbonyl reductase family member 4 [Elsinoe australis]
MASPTTLPALDMGLGLEGTHILVTGGAGLIGRVVVQAALFAGANVSSLDLSHPSDAFPDPIPGPSASSLLNAHADISSSSSLTTAWTVATNAFGPVSVCVALASLDLSVIPQTQTIIDADPTTWSRVLDVNVKGTMLTSQLWLRGLRDHLNSHPSASQQLKNPSLIIIGSEAGHFGVRTCAVYAAAKSAVQYGLLQSLRADAPRVFDRARVNAIAPGPVDTARFHDETGGQGTKDWWAECQATTALGKPVPAEAVARMVLVLASERWSGNVHGKCIDVDSGKAGALMWMPGEKGVTGA